MKHPLILALALSTTLISCEKNSEIEPPSDETLYDVTFDLSGFTRQTVEMNGSGKLMGTNQQTAQQSRYVINVLGYFVYRGYNLVHYKSQSRANPGEEPFGTIKDELPAGDYTIVFIGQNVVDLDDYGESLYFEDIEDYQKARAMTFSPEYVPVTIPDLFHKEFLIDIMSPTHVDSISLERVVGNVEVRLTDDEIPENVERIRAVTNSVDGFFFRPFPHEGVEGEHQISINFGPDDLEQLERDKTFEMFVLPYKRHQRTIVTNMRILASDENSQIIASKLIENIEVEDNKKTILTGSLFSGGNTPASQEFVVSADSIYSETDTLSF